MADIIRSSDMLAICFLLGGNSLDADIAEVIEHIEAYEQENACYIGTGPDDFRNALFWVAYDTGLLDFKDMETSWVNMKNVRLRDLVTPILNTRELSCNDEGEYWVGKYELADASLDSRGNWFDEYTDPVDIAYEYEIRRFFASPADVADFSAAAFFRANHTQERIVSGCFHRSF